MRYITMRQLGNYGRLGNQMFQYATLIGIAKTYDLVVLVPDGKYQLLETFTLDSPYKSLNLKTDMISWRGPYIERHFHYDSFIANSPSVYSLSRGTGIDVQGYFQTEKYFVHARTDVLGAFTFKDESIDLSTKEYFSKVDYPSVTIGVRRGDYTGLPDFHPIPSMDYYKSAIQKIYEMHGKCSYHIVSDDIEWCKYNFPSIYSEEYGSFHYPHGGYANDLALFKHSDHNIVGNSSFHWWGSWLNEKETKTVIAPSRWFGPRGPQDWHDIYCKDWIRL